MQQQQPESGQMRFVFVDRELDVRRAAKVLALSVRTVRWYCELGLIPGAYKLGDKSQTHWRIPEGPLVAWLEQRRSTAVRVPERRIA